MKPELGRFIGFVGDKAHKFIGQKRRASVISQDVPLNTDPTVLQDEREVRHKLSDEEVVAEMNRILNRKVPR